MPGKYFVNAVAVSSFCYNVLTKGKHLLLKQEYIYCICGGDL